MSKGLAEAAKGTLDIYVTFKTEDGKEVAQKVIKGVSDLTQATVETAVDIFGDITSRLDNLALDRAKQKVLAGGAARSIK